MTPNREDYLKTIYAANLMGEKITNKHISSELGVSPPSVTEMLQKLIDAELIMRDKSLGFTLTDKGKEGAQTVLKKHRLWEVFLVNYLGYSWDNVHDDAEVLEHATSDSLADRLNEFLDHPATCPHGSIIFGNDDIQQTISRIQLLDVPKGQQFVISEVGDHKRFLNYMKEKGLYIGLRLNLVSIDDYDGTRLLKDSSGHEYMISELATKEIVVEVV